MATLPFVAAYTKASGSQQVKATGLTVTCSVYRVTLADGTITRVVNAASATELTATGTTGAYFYHYSATLDFTLYWYFATFTTGDSTVQQVDIASAWFDYPLAAADDIAAIKARTDLIGTALVATSSPVAQGGDVEIIRGDDYRARDSRSLSWTGASADVWPDLTGAGISFQVLNGATVLLSVTGSVVTPTGTQAVRAEPTATQTATLAANLARTYKVVATLSNGDVVTLVEGSCTVSN